MNKELLKGHSELIVLAALSRQPMHGYALSEYAKKQMPGSFKFGVGMLYPLLHRLEKRGLIRGNWRESDGFKRRVYTLTGRGRKTLATKTAEWDAFRLLVNKVVSILP